MTSIVEAPSCPRCGERMVLKIASRSCRLKASVIAWSVETVGIGSVKVTPVGQLGVPAGKVSIGDHRGAPFPAGVPLQ